MTALGDQSTLSGTPPRPEVSDSSWRRFSFKRSLLWALMPVAIVTIGNLVLLALIVITDDTSGGLKEAFRFVDAHLESNGSTWVNASLWLIAAAVAGYVSIHAKLHRRTWKFFTAVCIYFSLDETALLHERLNVVFKDFGESLPIATYAWIIPGAIIAALIVVVLLRLVVSLPRLSRNGLFIGGILFVIGALGLDAIGGLSFLASGYSSLFVVLATMEEALEMTGVAILIASLLYLVETAELQGARAYRVSASSKPDRKLNNTSKSSLVS